MTITIDLANTLRERAKTRKDGVYSFKSYVWVAKGGRFVAYANLYGTCYQTMGGFDVEIGRVSPYDRKEKLTEWLKNQKNS